MTAPAVAAMPTASSPSAADTFVAPDVASRDVQTKLQYQKMHAGGKFRDQHGRVWGAQMDKETFHPCTPLSGIGWKAPHRMLEPPADVLTMGAAFGEIVIDYAKWLVQNNRHWVDFRVHVEETAVRMYKGAAHAMIAQNDPDLQEAAGPSPMHPDFIRAMMAGKSLWVLGMAPPGTPTPSWAVPLMHTLSVRETYDGSDVDLTITDDMRDRFVDDAPSLAFDDAQDVADRVAHEVQYDDLNDDYPAQPPQRVRRK